MTRAARFAAARPPAALAVLVAVLFSGCAVEREPLALDPTPSPTATSTSTPTPTPTPTPTFDATRYSIDDPASLWVVVNKRRPLAATTYVPADLVQANISATQDMLMRAATAAAAESMFGAAQTEAGLALRLESAYRSFDSQTRIYSGWVASLGQAGADLTSARPGHSEHQTGFAIDIGAVPATCSLDQCFADTAHGQWLAANAHRFGFTLRYPNGLTPTTGYEFEPWHYRYVGLELAAELHSTGTLTLEQFFGLPAAPDYGG